jgi:hypothetical protein
VVTHALHWRRVYLGLLWLGWALLITYGKDALAQSESASTQTAWNGPESVQLKDTDSVDLVLITSPDTKASDLKLFANVGTLSIPRATGPGTWSISLTLPEEKFPQVALLAAHLTGTSTVVFHQVNLLGRPTVTIQSEPRVSVRVEVNAESYGPKVTDAQGRVEFELPAPPGLSEVTTFATDSFGNVKKSQLPLPVEPFSRHLPVCVAGSNELLVFVVGPHGEPASSANFSVADSVFDWGTPAVVAPGVFRLLGTVRNHPTRETDVPVQVTLDGDVRSCSIRVPPPPRALPARVTGRVTPIEPFVPWRVGGLLGAVSNFARLTGPSVILRGAFSPGGALTGWNAEVDAGYTFMTAGVETDTGGQLSLAAHSVPLVAGVRYALQLDRSRLSARLHGGVDVFRVEISGEGTAETETVLAPMIGGQFAYSHRFGPGEIQAELGYAHAPVVSGPARGNAAGLQLSFGYLFFL